MNPRGMILALETSQRKSSVALGPISLESHCDAISCESIDTQNRLVEDVLPAVQRLCARANISRDQIGAVALNAGPGGFTGLRIAHASAQVIAESLSIPIVQISAAVVARESAVIAGSIAPDQIAWVALAAKNDGCWMAKVSQSSQGNDDPEQVGVRTLEQWPVEFGEILIADEHLPAPWKARAEALNIQIVALEPTAEAVLHVARRMLASNRALAPQYALPVYPREAEAVRLWRERHGTP